MKRAIVFISIVLLITMYTFYRNSYAKGEIMELRSTFANNERMPDKYTCKETKQGGVSPEMQWTNVPDGVQSFVLVCQDPDAVGGIFTHWVVYNLPADTRHLPEGAFISKIDGAQEGFNSGNKLGWYHACPPAGTGEHRYIFTLYALDKKLDLSGQILVDDVKKAMNDSVLGTTELIGLYSIES